MKRELCQIPPEVCERIIENYRTQISKMLAEEKSEEEILQRLGSPKLVAKEVKQVLGYEFKKLV